MLSVALGMFKGMDGKLDERSLAAMFQLIKNKGTSKLTLRSRTAPPPVSGLPSFEKGWNTKLMVITGDVWGSSIGVALPPFALGHTSVLPNVRKLSDLSAENLAILHKLLDLMSSTDIGIIGRPSCPRRTLPLGNPC